MNDVYGFPYLTLEEICDKLDVICSDIDRMNFGAARDHAVQLQNRVVRMTVRNLEVLLKDEKERDTCEGCKHEDEGVFSVYCHDCTHINYADYYESKEVE